MSLTPVLASGMKFLTITLCAVVFSGRLLAAGCSSDCAIDVHFTGEYSDETCNISINQQGSNTSVSLPRVAISALKQHASEAGSVPFEITLQDCPASRTIRLFFNSSASRADPVTGNLLNDAGDMFSNHVQIRLRKENNAQVIIDRADTGQDYMISASAAPLTHRFTASYYANGSGVVSAGKVHAAAGVELVYK